MSKVICDVCGTTYPETASVCPICGCAKNTTEQTGADIAQGEESGAYTYVKGGRFSKANVRRRNKKGKGTIAAQNADRESTNKGLVVVVLLLLIAIIAVLGYIGVRFLFPRTEPTPENPGISQETGDKTPSSSTNPSAPVTVPCTSIELGGKTIQLTEAGMSWQLEVKIGPYNTTDKVAFVSSNEQVAIVRDAGIITDVDDDGKLIIAANITAVGGGEAIITVTCGEIKAECKIVCTFEPVGPTTEPTVPEVTVPDGFELKLNRKDFTLTKAGESWTLFKETNGIKPSDITWTVDDPEVATVVDGKVTGVDYGDTTVHATIGDQTVSCTVRVRFQAPEPGTETEDALKMNKTDVTIKVGETFSLTLTDSEGVKMDVQWVASEEGFVTIDGSRITGAADTDSAGIKITGTYEEKTYTCIVRVRTPKEEQ